MLINKITNVNFNNCDISIISLTFLFYLIFEYNKQNTDLDNIRNIALFYSILLLFSDNDMFRCLINVFCVLVIVIFLNMLDKDKIILMLVLMFFLFLIDMYMIRQICCKMHDPSLTPTLIKNQRKCKKEYRNYMTSIFVIIMMLII
ncbi:hypothetical protein Hokovirus_3_144 [Hokovirus HKV1]|uniref:Uncharacterized protein n=1 Tax=Hokovirus HKV1 TaxID=1977638 RepID=A0A1V0SGS1_9VIRU|nr:hypothetical protein Hokovirus_3_144 [Hokovirus HKV1]